MFLQKGKKSLSISWAVFSIIICIILLKTIIMYTIFNINETEFLYILNHKDSLVIIFNAIKNDFIIFISLIILELFLLKTTTKIIKYFLILSIIVICTLYIIDSVIIYSGTRLFITDAFKYVASMPASAVFAIAIVLLLLFFSYMFLIKKRHEISVNKAILLIVGFFLFYISPIHISTYYMKEDLLSTNMYTTNMQIRYIKDYKNKDELKKNYENKFINQEGQVSNKNIILIVDESLSAVDSHRISGLRHYLTGFDTISQDGILYTNMIANGNTTDAGLISLLKGVETMPFTLDIDYYNSYKAPTESLPSLFNNRGYETNFFTTGPLDFLDKEGFLKAMGYRNITGSQKYKGEETYAFWSAPDTFLYKDSLEYIKDKQKTKDNYFLTMLTISSHLPYDTPYGKTKESMYRFTDELLLKFYEDLKETDFFDNGLLIVVGDHRKMTPLEPGEYLQYGESAYSRISCLVVGKNIEPKIDNNVYQQTDIFYSIKTMFGDKIKVIDNYNNIFTTDIKRDYALATSFADKENIVVIQKQGKNVVYNNITLNAEKTKIKDRHIYLTNSNEIIKYVNQVRGYQMSLQDSITDKIKIKFREIKKKITENN